jgi:DNA-binding transcriptional regulator YiaG
MHPSEYEHHQRLIGLMQLSGVIDTAVATALSTSPAAVNAWRRRGRVPRAALPGLRSLLAAHIGKPIDDQGHLLGDDAQPIVDHTGRRRAVEDTGCHAPTSRSHTWRTQRDVLIALAGLGPSARAIARSIGEPHTSVACWLRMARVPNERMADLASKIRMARAAGETGVHVFAGTHLDDGGYMQAVDDTTINARLNRLIEASGLRLPALAERLSTRLTTVAGWRQRRRVPTHWRRRLVEALSPALGATIRADGLIPDGHGGWVEWGACCPGGAETRPAHLAQISGIRNWLDDQIDSALDDAVPQARREALQQQALAAMAAAASAAVSEAADIEAPRPPAPAARRKRRYTAS